MLTNLLTSTTTSIKGAQFLVIQTLFTTQNKKFARGMPITIKTTFRSIFLVFLSSLLIACFTPPENDKPIIIGLLIDKSTPGGPPSINAAKLYIDKINAQGGLNTGKQKRQLELVIEDTLNQKDSAVEAARRLIFEHKVTAIVGPNMSSTAYSASAVAESAGQLMISPGATSTVVDKNKKFVFRIAFSNSEQGNLLAKFAQQELSLPNTAVLYNIGNPSSRVVAEAFKERYVSLGGKISAFEFYISGTKDFSKQISQIRLENTQAVLLPNATKESKAQLEGLKQSGFKGFILGSDNWSPLKVTTDEQFNDAYYAHHWHPEYAKYNKKAKQFLDEYRSKHSQDPTSMSALTYDALGILGKAIEHSFTANTEITTALKSIGDFSGVTGKINLNKNNKHYKKPIIINVKNNANKIYRSPNWVLD
ncbi:ABC transporter substrate-binding protein [Aliikangiella coralliicola]|uniref:ABC transporter substrate-binding protein n=1 Tax=Aliikangiella coralliicola TaxID=2592383 RepID=A0A545UHV3_9GAMM|nr:ABC transporter substrate-binding protein [Aliikangiella coralliicola]TQV89054.1 ABC transporter substrate-binding protein [Aliikangiella coralliicola]